MKTTLAILFALCVAGCGKSPEAAKISEENLAKASLEKIVRVCKSHYPSWGTYDDVTIRYNAVKTESIVAPITGTIYIRDKSDTRYFADINLAWRDSKWGFISCKGTDVGFNGGERFVVDDINTIMLGGSGEENTRRYNMWADVREPLAKALAAQTLKDD